MECDQCLLEWRWCALLGWGYACLAWQLPTGSPWLSLGFISSVQYGMKRFNHQIPECESGNKVHAWTCIERNDFSFCRTVWNWSLFLVHPTHWHERVTSENAKNSYWCWFWIFNVSCKIRVLKQPLICIVVLCFQHNNIAWIHLCDECTISNAPSVCHKIWSVLLKHAQACSQTTKYQVFQYEPNTDISEQFVSKFSYWLIFFFFKLMVIHASRCDIAKLLSRFICKFAISFHTFLCVTFHVIGPRRYCFCVRFPWSSGR